jgi:ABC-type Fe3+-siderophore transport system permease subunit
MLWGFLLIELLLWIAVFGFNLAPLWIGVLMASIGALFLIYLLLASRRTDGTTDDLNRN